MAASSFLASLVVALTTHIAAAGTCSTVDLTATPCAEGKSKDPELDGTDADTCCTGKCAETCTGDLKNNPALSTKTAAGGTAEDITKCCQPSCKSEGTLTVACDAGKGKEAAEVFCPGNADPATPCSTAVCCTVSLAKCVIANCKKNNDGEVQETGKYVLTAAGQEDAFYCASAACTNTECCEPAGECAACDTVDLDLPNRNKFCVTATCVPERECCKTTVTLVDATGAALVEGAVTFKHADMDKFEIGDTFVVGALSTIYTIDSKVAARRLAETAGRRLAAGNMGFSPGITAAGAAAIAGGTGVITLSPAMAASAVSDPITFYKGYKTKFWLPNDKLTLLLETKDIKLYASVLEGPSEDLQWFGSFYVFNSDDSKLCEIDVNRNEIRSPDSFEQIVIKLGDSDTPLPAQIQTYGSKNGKVKFSISTMPWNTPGDYNFTQVQELVYFETDDLVFMILPSHAGNEFPTSKTLALKYMHLDFIVREMKGEEQFGGILPEFWGLKVRSEEAYAMLTKPSRSRAISGDDCGNCNGAPFWE